MSVACGGNVVSSRAACGGDAPKHPVPLSIATIWTDGFCEMLRAKGQKDTETLRSLKMTTWQLISHTLT